MSQFIPPSLFHFSTATITYVAGQVAGTIVAHRAAGAQTSLVTIPIVIPSNSVALKGSLLKSIEIDYELQATEPTSITFTINKVTRGADTAVAVVAAQAFTAAIAAAGAKTVDQHKQVLTITTPFWVLNTEYVLVEMSMVCPTGGTAQFLGAVANFTERL
jgi:hypothetical protein